MLGKTQCKGKEGFVLFDSTPNGWRVVKYGLYLENVGRKLSVITIPAKGKPNGELLLTGTIVKHLRPGTFCKRPHHYVH